MVVAGPNPAAVDPVPLLPGPQEASSSSGQERPFRTVPPGTVAVVKSLHGGYSEITLTTGETGWVPHALLVVADHFPDKEGPND